MNRIRFWMTGALLATAASCVDRIVGSDPPDSPSGLFDLVWNDFDRNYAMFGIKRVDWDDAYRRYKPKADAARSQTELAPVIGEMFRELQDLHVDLISPGGKFYSSIDNSAVHTYFNPLAITGRYATGTVTTPSRKIRYGKLAPDVGWIWIASFSGDGWAGEIGDALRALGGVSAVVLDVRNNGGGSTNNSEPIAGSFVDAERVFSYYQYRNGPRHDDLTPMRALKTAPTGTRFGGKVVVLMNRFCASATESFLLSLRVQPGIVFVGDTTAGALGNPMLRELANGWVYRLPQWVQYDANKVVIENIGIAPDVVVKMTAADSAAGRDLQLERALATAQGK
jgi:hypothetical protein